MDDDADLVDRLRAGDESAFVALIERYQQRMMRLAELTVGSAPWPRRSLRTRGWLSFVVSSDSKDARHS